MFSLEQSISDWREQMLAAGIKNPETLEELELHLRQDFAVLVAAGMTEAQAFPSAVARLGDSDSMRREFRKIGRAQQVPVLVVSAAWFALVLVLGVVLLKYKLLTGRMTPLLCAHVFAVVGGYTAAFVMGGFGMYYVWLRSFRKLSPAGEQSLTRAVRLFCRFSLAFVAVGFLLGMLWSKQNWGGYLNANPRKLGTFLGGDPLEIGAICVLLWLGAIMTAQHFRWAGERATMLLCVGGSLTVMFAWFGARLLAKGAAASDVSAYWPLILVAGFHLASLLTGSLPARDLRAKCL